ncbi:MAG TPA: COX15/CtaA family protein [Saprospiraceae bacterium]|nr:COX15/CtaA family protein [Saprospiraceae bacterium]HMP14102.1 COX15/CtaA family protein [Saprospiraceae bacterium]
MKTEVMPRQEKLIENGVVQGYPRAVKMWLIIGLIMIFGQVVIGGVTRLTGSGLSITKWEIVTGTLPPLSAEAWEEAFDLYKDTPQYRKINAGMTMGEFKFIYFWEYFHRLWARTMGFVFLIPFIIFWRRGWLDKVLMQRLGIVVLLAALAASFGWIMVASGLIERPWVNAYKLTLHLSIAFIVYSYLLWTTLRVLQPTPPFMVHPSLQRWTLGITILASVQIVLGGIMSGTKAALFYPTWPDMKGECIPGLLLQAANWNVENFVQYDATPFLVACIQFLHRSVAYVLIISALWFFGNVLKAQISPAFRVGSTLLIIMLGMQALLGVLTLVYSVGVIPVALGVLHQGGALLLLTIALFLNYQFAGSRR